MGRNSRKASASEESPAASGSTDGVKRARHSETAQSAQSTLLANNKFAVLPVQEVPTKVRVPPLFTSSKDVAALRAALAVKQIHPLFKLCSTGTKIMCSTMDDFNEVSGYLAAFKHEFYTHDTPGSKPMKVIIRGLPEYSPEAIMSELKAAKLKPLKVFPIRRGEPGTHRDKLYLVHIEKGSVTMADLVKTRALFSIIIEWERYRPKKKDVTQCGNCMAFGHGTRNCHMRSRCGKCAGPHTTADCQQMDEGVDPKCANCGANHAGNNRACPKRAQFLEIRKRASTQNQRDRRQKPPPPRTEEHFPALRYQVPNLPPLQPHRQQPSHQPKPSYQAKSVHPRLAAAAAAPHAQPPPTSAWGNPGRSTPPPGWGNTGLNNTTAPLDDGPMFTPEQMVEYTRELYTKLRCCRSRQEQLEAATLVMMNFLHKYGP